MALSIKDPEADRLARELAAKTGESLTDAVTGALRERLSRVEGQVKANSIAADLARIRRHSASRPVLDARSPDDVLGYGNDGLAH